MRTPAAVGDPAQSSVPRSLPPSRDLNCRRRALAGRRAQKPQIANIKKQNGSRRERRCLENLKVLEAFWCVMLNEGSLRAASGS